MQERLCGVFGVEEVRKGARMIPRLEAATHRVTKPTKEGTPSHNHLDTFDSIWQYGVATYFENETASRQIGIHFPLAGSRRAASIRIVPESAAGSSGRVRRGNSLGETTQILVPFIANQPCTLQATDDDGIPSSREQRPFSPSLCCAHSESSICSL